MVDPQTRIMELQEQVAKLTEDKEKLYKDLESMLMQNSSSSFWSGSSVLYDRISEAEAELKATQTQKSDLEAQLQNCKDDVAHLRAMKRAADEISKREIEKSLVLDRELTYYKQRGSQWLEEKNIKSYELESLKRENIDLEVSLKESRANFDVQMGLREEAEQRFVECQKKASQLEARLIDCGRIPELENKLRHSKEENERLSSEMDALENEFQTKQEEIDGLYDKLEKEHAEFLETIANLKIANERASTEAKALKEKIIMQEAELSSLNSSLQSQSCDLERKEEVIASAKAEADFAVDDKERELKETREMYDLQIAALNDQLKESESKLAHQISLVKIATDAKVEALVQKAEAQSELSDLKMGLSPGAKNPNRSKSNMKPNGSDQSSGKGWWGGQSSVQS